MFPSFSYWTVYDPMTRLRVTFFCAIYIWKCDNSVSGVHTAHTFVTVVMIKLWSMYYVVRMFRFSQWGRPQYWPLPIWILMCPDTSDCAEGTLTNLHHSDVNTDCAFLWQVPKLEYLHTLCISLIWPFLHQHQHAQWPFSSMSWTAFKILSLDSTVAPFSLTSSGILAL